MRFIREKIAFIIPFHAATMHREKAPWQPVHLLTKSQQFPPHPKHLDQDSRKERGQMGVKQVTMKRQSEESQQLKVLRHPGFSLGDTQPPQAVRIHPQVLSLAPTSCCYNTAAVVCVWLGHTHRSKGILKQPIQWLRKRNPLVPTYQRCLFCFPSFISYFLLD